MKMKNTVWILTLLLILCSGSVHAFNDTDHAEIVGIVQTETTTLNSSIYNLGLAVGGLYNAHVNSTLSDSDRAILNSVIGNLTGLQANLTSLQNSVTVLQANLSNYTCQITSGNGTLQDSLSGAFNNIFDQR